MSWGLKLVLLNETGLCVGTRSCVACLSAPEDPCVSQKSLSLGESILISIHDDTEMSTNFFLASTWSRVVEKNCRGEVEEEIGVFKTGATTARSAIN